MAQREPVVPERMSVTVKTRGGVQVDQWLCDQYKSIEWTREKSKPSKCDLIVPRRLRPPPLTWHHWAYVYDQDAPRDKALLWRGPIVHRARGKDFWTISARDTGALMHKTRNPLTKRWDAQYPAAIAAEMWSAMLDLHGLDIIPQVMDDPLGDPFDFESKRDEKSLAVVMEELVKLGLEWTVVGGTPVLGPMPLEPVAALAERDFLDHNLELVEDGTAACNDLVMRGPDTIGRGRVPLPDGLVLQGIANADDMFGVSNVDKAIRQYLRYHSTPREYLSGDQVKLRPRADIALSQIVPSARVTIGLYDSLHLMEIESLKVTADESGSSASMGVTAVNDDLPELDSNVEPGAL